MFYSAFLFSSCNAVESPKPEIPILAWFSIPEGEYTTLEQYEALRDAGFTVSYSHTSSFEGALKALDLCAEVGIKSVFACRELASDPEGTALKVKDHPGLGYYFLRDEPWNSDLEALGEWARKIESVDSDHPCYLNLFPSYVDFSADGGYREHLRLFSEKVALPQISFDHYPVLYEDGKIFLNGAFYENLELVSAEARRTGKPFWAFALATAHSTSHWHYPIPTIGHLRLQMYSDLAYGAQCLQYFTYWTPVGTHFDFHAAPLNADGTRSETYYLIREFNKEIQARADVFLGCEVSKVSHIGDTIPTGTTRLENLPEGFTTLETFGKGALVSELSNAGKDYVVIQNTSPEESIELAAGFNKKVRLVSPDGARSARLPGSENFVLTAGDILVFEL